VTPTSGGILGRDHDMWWSDGCGVADALSTVR
jgi:hypothetical protein